MSLKFRNVIAVLLLALSTTVMPMIVNAQDDVAEDTQTYNTFSGVLDEIGEGFIVVAGLTFDTTSAEFSDDDDTNDDDTNDDDTNDDDSVDSFQIGQRVEVKFIISDGTFVAVEVEDLSSEDDDQNDDDQNDDDGDDEDDDHKIVGDYLIGSLDEIGEGFIIVAGVTFDTSEAELGDDVTVGAIVIVDYSVADDQNSPLQALSVSIYSEHDDDGECMATQPNDWVSYTVKEGDTLSAIAIASRTELEDLLEVNCIEHSAIIFVGMTLYVEHEPDFTIIVDDDDDDNDDDNGDDDNGDDNGDDDSNDDDGNDDDEDDDNGGDDGNDDDEDHDNGGDDGGDDDGGDDDNDDDSDDD